MHFVLSDYEISERSIEIFLLSSLIQKITFHPTSYCFSGSLNSGTIVKNYLLSLNVFFACVADQMFFLARILSCRKN